MSNPVILKDDNPTDEQLTLALERAKDTFGGVHTDYESEEFQTEFDAQLNTILTEEALENLIADGWMEKAVTESGEIGYIPTARGRQIEVS